MRTAKNYTIIHGVFLNIFEIGVLLTGRNGIGKSELALTLITRGHQLVADDAPQFTYQDNTTLIGSCPELLRGFLEVKDLGILNIKNLFGDYALKSSAPLQLVINLIAINNVPDDSHTKILNIKIPQISINISTARNQAVLIETAVRNFALKQKGYDASLDFANKQKQLLSQEKI